MSNTSGHSRRWYRLDNAAKLYPAIKTENWSSVFRVAVLMRARVDSALLQQALEKILPRFPYFAVQIKRGLFWYYFEHNSNTPKVQEDSANPCMRMKWHENNNFLFRVCYYERRIAVEFFHALSDGSGALIFLKTLIAEYLRLNGVQVSCTEGVFDINEIPEPEEDEDAYARHSTQRLQKSRLEPRAYHMKGTLEPVHTLHVITGTSPIEPVLKAARSFKVSITELLVAVLVHALYLQQYKENRTQLKAVKVSVPINMRRFFPTKSMRNFSLYVNPGIEPGYGLYTFEEILEQVHHFMRMYINDKHLNAQMAKNVRSERNLFVRAIPLFIKNLALTAVYNAVGEKQFSSVITNVGEVKVPDEMREHIERFEMLLGVSLLNHVNCAVSSFEGYLTMNFSRTIKETDIERAFFSHLVKLGIPVKVQSNQQ